MIPYFEVKSKIGKIFKKHNPLEEYSVMIYKIDPYLWTLWKKLQVDNNGCKYILFRIDIYFSECSLAVEIDEKGHTDRDINFEEKRQKVLEKTLGSKFIRINTSNDLDYKVGYVQIFIDKFKIKKIKKLEKQLIKEKRNERETRNIKNLANN